MNDLPDNVVVIGLHGPMGSGKDILTTLLINKFPDLYILRFKCATHLYAMAAAFDEAFDPNMSQELKKGYVLDDHELITRRAFLENLGTEFGRNCVNKNVWVKRLHYDIREAGETSGSEPMIAIVTDIRFPNEADYVRENGVLVHLQPEWLVGESAHPSAQPLPINKYDHVIKPKHNEFDSPVYQLRAIIAQATALAFG